MREQLSVVISLRFRGHTFLFIGNDSAEFARSLCRSKVNGLSWFRKAVFSNYMRRIFSIAGKVPPGCLCLSPVCEHGGGAWQFVAANAVPACMMMQALREASCHLSERGY